MKKTVDGAVVEEEWKTLPLDETVQLSSFGRVRRNGKIKKKGKPDKDGYLRLTVKKKSYRLHRLIAELFVENPNPELYTVVDHINNQKDCNEKTNLRWVTPQMNSQYAADMGLQTRLKNDNSYVIAYDAETKDGHIYRTVADCAKILKLNATEIFTALAGKRKSIKGYKFVKINLDKKEIKKYFFNS